MVAGSASRPGPATLEMPLSNLKRGTGLVDGRAMSPAADQMSRPEETRAALPRRAFVVVLVAVVVMVAVLLVAPRFIEARHQEALSATRLLVQSIELPAPAVEGCEGDEAQRCWTTPSEGRASIEGFIAVLGSAGATDITERCSDPVPQLSVPSCSVTGWYRGAPVLISSDPILFIGPPLHSKGSTIQLLATVTAE